MLIEIHLIQNHAPSNLNRDDTGSPKTCVFGDTNRARISSQCIKRSIRRSEIFGQQLVGKLGTRTRQLPERIKEAAAKLGCDAVAAQAIGLKASGLGSGKESEDLETRQLVFLDPTEVDALTAKLKAMYDRLGAVEFKALRNDAVEKELSGKLPRSVDIALFGRMTTSAAFQDVQASMQVAHAISTHQVSRQFDYFTAVDDLVDASGEDKGAGMIGDVEFNSATYYKYFCLDWASLVKNLGGDSETALAAVGAFIRAAALVSPTGKQNTFAAHNPPDAVLVEVKDQNVPISYVNAFVKAIQPSRENDVIGASIKALSDYRKNLNGAYGIEPAVSAYLTVRGEKVDGSAKSDNLSALIESVKAAIQKGTAA